MSISSRQRQADTLNSKVIYPGRTQEEIEQIKMPELPAMCCAKCIYWQKELAQQADKSLPPAAPCRRYPPRLLVIPVPVQIPPAQLAQMRVDPRMSGQIPPNGIIMQDRPTPTRDVSSAIDWCGEFDPIQTPITT